MASTIIYKGGCVQMVSECKTEEEKATVRKWFDSVLNAPDGDIEELCNKAGVDLYGDPLSEQAKQKIAASKRLK